MTLKNDTLTYDISALIIDTIIGDLFFRDEEVLVDADCDNDSEDDVTNAIAKKAAKKSNEKTSALNRSSRMRTILIGIRLLSRTSCG